MTILENSLEFNYEDILKNTFFDVLKWNLRRRFSQKNQTYFLKQNGKFRINRIVRAEIAPIRLSIWCTQNLQPQY